jgi:hypothetical protein
MLTGEVTVQVGGLLAPARPQLSATAPVNPPDGVTVIVDVPLAPPAGSVTDPLLLREIAGVVETAAVTRTGTVTDAFTLPSAPLMLTM